MDQQRANKGPDGSYDLNESHSFVYEALLKELYIGNVYLRVYNDQPDFEISEPEVFCIALVDFISHLVHDWPAADSGIHVNGDMTTESSMEQVSCDDSSEPIDMKIMDKSELELVKSLQYALTSLQVCTSIFLFFF